MPSVTGSANIRPGGAPPAAGDDLVPYQYVVLRCVPRVEREEFVNIGVVLFAFASRPASSTRPSCSTSRG